MASRERGSEGLKARQFWAPRDTGPEGRMVSGAQRTETMDNHSAFCVHDSRHHRKSWHLLTECKPCCDPCSRRKIFKTWVVNNRTTSVHSLDQKWLSIVLAGQVVWLVCRMIRKPSRGPKSATLCVQFFLTRGDLRTHLKSKPTRHASRKDVVNKC